MGALAALHAAGLTLEYADGRLRVGPSERLTQDLRAPIHQHRCSILADLVASPTATWSVVWPADSPVPTIHGKWRRLEDGRIEAVYSREELELCLTALGKWPPPRRCAVCAAATAGPARAYCRDCWPGAAEAVP